MTAPIAHDPAKGRDAVLNVLEHAETWLTDDEIRLKINLNWPSIRISQSGVGARRRDLRKHQYGGRKIKGRVRVGQPGVHEYRLVPVEPLPLWMQP